MKTNDSLPSPSSLLVIGNPLSKRVTGICDAWRAQGGGACTVVSHQSLLQHPEPLPIAPDVPTMVRIESVGEDVEVHRLLLSRGADAEPTTLDLRDVQPAAQWYRGFTRYLGELEELLNTSNGVAVFRASSPSEIAIMFDKTRTSALLETRGLPVPPRLECVTSHEALRSEMLRRGMTRVFVKPRYGSSASGTLAYETGKRADILRGPIILRREAGRIALGNTRRIRVYSAPQDIEAIVDKICLDGAHVERWVPKASFGRDCFDVRMLAIGGRAAHRVVRVSGSAMTNLHLGNRRGSHEVLRPREWRELERIVEDTATCFPLSLQIGIDILVSRVRRRPVILEVNAFGDLLHGSTHEALTPYEFQVREVLDRLRSQAPPAR